MNNYAISITNLPGYSHIGAKEHREEIIHRFATRTEAEDAASERAAFGGDFEHQYAVLVSRKTPFVGWKVLSQHHCEIWD